MGKVFATVSGKGGTGKSTLCCTLGTSIAVLGNSVVIVDLDFGLRCQDIFFGIESDVVFDLSDALSTGNYDNSIYLSEVFRGVAVVPAPNTEGIKNKVDFLNFIDYLKMKYDYVFLDFPAGLDFSLLDGIPDLTCLCVSNSDPISVRDAYAVKSELKKIGIEPLLIINKFEAALMESRLHKNFDDIIDTSDIQLLGVIPYSKELSVFSVTHQISNRSKAKKAIKRIVNRICGYYVPLPKPSKI